MKHRSGLHRFWSALVLAGAMNLVATSAHAQAASFPSRPVTLLLPLAAGSAGDVALRLVAQKMAENLKQAVIVENQPGAAGLIGTERVVRAPPDGYVLGGLGDSILNFAVNLTPKPPFNPRSDLEPVALVATIPWTLAVNAQFGAKNLSEFIAHARANPGRVDYASTGRGSASRIGTRRSSASAASRRNDAMKHHGWRDAARKGQAGVGLRGGQTFSSEW